MNKVLAIDIDGVLADFEGEFCERFGYENRYEANLHKRYPNVPADLITEFIEDPNTYTNYLKPIFGGITLTHQAYDHGYKVILITSRPFSTYKNTCKWLGFYNVKFDGLYYGKMKWSVIEDYETKTKNKVVALIDDIAGNLQSLPKHTTGILWDQPWNAMCTPPKMTYDQGGMKLVIKPDTVSGWVDFWTGK